MDTKLNKLFIGIDLGNRRIVFNILDSNGECQSKGKFPNTREHFDKFSKKYPKATIAIEVGTHSPWISRLLEDLGHKDCICGGH